MASDVQRSSLLTWLMDPLQPTREHAAQHYRFTGNPRIWMVLVGIGIGLLVLSAVGWVVNPTQFYFSYHTGWVFCLTISLGALYFLLFHHLTRAKWSIVVRRLAEGLAWGFPLLAVLGLPLLFGMHDLFHWTHDELYVEGAPGYDPILAGKRAYLNEPFFFVRVAFYFVVWTIISYRLYAASVRNDVEPDRETPARLRTTSAWALPLTAVTTAFASYDLLMSLEPHWFSTIFGVYLFAGAVFAVFALVALVGIVLQRQGGMLRGVITVEHYQDLGKYMFGWTVFWAYIAFSQYMLIWYAGLPEETLWFRERLEHGWGWHSAMLLIMHFIVPFFFLLPRFTKRFIPTLSVMTVWFLVVHWFDLHWIVMPTLHPEQAGFHWLDFACWLGLFSLFMGFYLRRLGRHALVPQNDPHLARSLRFENT